MSGDRRIRGVMRKGLTLSSACTSITEKKLQSTPGYHYARVREIYVVNSIFIYLRTTTTSLSRVSSRVGPHSCSDVSPVILHFQTSRSSYDIIRSPDAGVRRCVPWRKGEVECVYLEASRNSALSRRGIALPATAFPPDLDS